MEGSVILLWLMVFVLSLKSGQCLKERQNHHHHDRRRRTDDTGGGLSDLTRHTDGARRLDDFQATCSSQSLCTECIKSSFCHWCAFDNACHARGSVHGCFSGVSDCANTTEPNTTSVCQAQTNCSGCSKLDSCNWCGRDNACRAKNDVVHGCSTGSHCYTDDNNCQRTKPQTIRNTTSPGMLTVVCILAAGIACCGCAFWGCRVFSEAKTAHDYAFSVGRATNAAVEDQPTIEESGLGDCPGGGNDQSSEDGGGEVDPLLAPQHTPDHYRLMEDRPIPSPPRAVQNRRAYFIALLCQVTSVLLLICIPGLVWLSIRYFPRPLIYNVCASDNDWKSITSVMSSTKESGDAVFELLFSFQNPNHLDVSVDFGRGKFVFGEAVVGTFEIQSNTIIPSMSITDVLVYTSLPVDKWQGLGLHQAYKKGALVMSVSAEASLRTPSLFNFTYEASFRHHEIKPSAPKLTERYLCSCKN